MLLINYKGEKMKQGLIKVWCRIICFALLVTGGVFITVTQLGVSERIVKLEDPSVKSFSALGTNNEKNNKISAVTLNNIGIDNAVFNMEGDALTWNILRTKANRLQDLGLKGNEIKVAIFDTGIDLNSNEIKVSGGISFIEGIESYDDDNGHGTAMAGILAAQLNGMGIVGIAPSIELYSVKVLDKDGNGKYSTIIKGIEWAIDNGIDIISLSLGGTQYSKALEDAVQLAADNNILIVAAAGNDSNNKNTYPAAYPQVICVGAINDQNEIASFSNIGTQVDIFAPGELVITTGTSNSIIKISGTSAAAQHVAGAAALLLSKNKDLSIVELTEVLLQGSDLLRTDTDDNSFYGILNIEKSYELLNKGLTSKKQINNDWNVGLQHLNRMEDGTVYALATCSHTWTTTTKVSPTCTATGTQNYVCSKCKATKSESIAALGHSMVYGPLTPPTCTKDGSYKAVCSRCGYDGTTIIAATGHTLSTTTTAATCTTNGTITNKCSKCTYSLTTFTPFADHTLTTTTTAATCTTNGTITKKCSKCTYSLTTFTPFADHTLTTTTTAATCTANGSKVTTCSKCSYSSTVVITALGHNFVYNESSSHTTGSGHYYTSKCSVCGYIGSSGYNNYGSYSSTGSHTSTGHLVQYKCNYCGTQTSSNYTTVSTCVSCTTAPSVSFGNITGDTILKETDTAFQLQIKVQDNENDTLTCNYYLDGSTTSSGTTSATGTSTLKTVTFPSIINVSNLSEGSHTIRATVKDSIAPLGEATVTFKVDKSAPVVTSVIVDPTINSAKLTVSATDSIAGLAASAYRFTIAGVTTDWLSTSYYNCPNLLANTVYSYSVDVIDKVGHIATTNTSTFSTKVDTPVVIATALSENKVQLIIKDANPTTTNYKIQIGSSYATANGSITNTETWSTLPYDAASAGKLLVVSGLSPNVVYSITATAKNGATGTEVSGQGVSITSSPAVPANLSVTGKSYNYVQLSWSSVTAATAYQLSRETLSNEGAVLSTKQFAETVLLSCEDSDVLSNQNYRYKVRTKNAAGLYSSWSTLVVVKTLPLPPEKVSGVSVEANGKNLNITWGKVAEAIGYKVKIKYDGKTTEKSTTTNQLVFDTGLYNCQCDITVQAFNVTDSSDLSDSTKWKNGGVESESVIFYTNANTPTLQPISLSKVTPYSVNLKWNTNDNPASVQYKLSIFSNNILVRELIYNSVSGTTYECTVSGLLPETSYSFKVKAMNSTGINTEWSNEISATTLMDYPRIPSGLRATAKADKITLFWETAENAQGYLIERNGVVIDDNHATNSYVDDEVSAETEYTYRVKAKNTTGTSDWSQPLTKKTLGNLLTPPVLSINGDSISMTVEWTPVEGATGYDLEIDDNIYNVGLDISYIHNGLEPGSLHNYRIRTRNIYGKGDWSDIVTIQTTPSIPVVPNNIEINTTNKQIKINWSSVSGATSYEVEIDGVVYSNITSLEYVHTVSGDMAAGTEHLVRVSAKNEGGQGEWSQGYMAVLAGEGESSFPVEPIPVSPELESRSIGSSMIQVQWNEVEGATIYQLEVDGTILYSGAVTNYLHIGLEENSQHQYRVSAGNFSGFSEWSIPIIISTTTTVSTTPTNITYYRETESSTTITWDSTDGVDGYRVEVNGDLLEGILYERLVTINTVAGEQYNVRIASIIQNEELEELDWSEEFTFTAPKKLPKTPYFDNVSAEADTIMIAIGKSNGALGYELEFNGQVIDIHNCSIYSISGLEPSTTNQIKIRAYNETGRSDWSETVAIMTNEGIPGVPINITGKSVADISSLEGFALSISWKALEGVVSYEVEDEHGVIYTTDTNHIIIKNLIAGKQYTYRVRALTEAGAGAWSSRITVTPQITVPTGVAAVAKDGVVRISWDEMGGVGYYEIEVDGITVATTEGTSYEFDYETFYKNRTIRIRACNGTQKSEWSQKTNFDQAIPMTAELLKDEEITVLLPVENADINRNKFIITFNTHELTLIDAFAITFAEETTSIFLSDYNTHIIIEWNDNLCTIIFLLQSEENTVWSGIASSIKFKSLATGTVTLYYEVTER